LILGIVRLSLLSGLIVAAGIARADNTVTIGAIYSLAHDAGARAAIETAQDVINTPHPGLDKLPLGAGQGLPGLAGVKLAVSFADDLANPSVAQAQALRFMTQDHVAALIGVGPSPQTLAATALAERHGTPFLVPDATDPKITARGFNWVFRTTPLGTDDAHVYMQFLAGLKAANTKIDTIALLYEATERGKAEAALLSDAAKAAGFSIAPELGYTPGNPDLSAVVTALRTGNPDVVIADCNAVDARLLVATMNTLKYKPPLLIGDDDGFSDPGFIAANGNLAQGVIDRSAWSAGQVGSPTAIVNQLYKAKSGHDLDDTSTRVIQGVFVLADAINHAGSTDPAAIQKALQQTDLKPDQLIVGYNGVKFDATGQNTLASTYLLQLQGKQYVSVWPAASSAEKLVLPFKGWE
jgi:branched-chain amino acid transport system substrate-binding protein